MPIKCCSETYFFRLEVLKSQTRYPSLCSEFIRPKKIHRPQPGLNSRTLDLEASTLPRDHRGRLSVTLLSTFTAFRPVYCNVQVYFYLFQLFGEYGRLVHCSQEKRNLLIRGSLAQFEEVLGTTLQVLVEL